jgi:hypothetical protein
MYKCFKICCWLLCLVCLSHAVHAQKKKRAKKTTKQVIAPKKKKQVKKVIPKVATRTALISIPKQANNLNTAFNTTSSTDTGGNRTVVITSSFKPLLQYAAKINFTAASAITDSSKLLLNYKIPSSNLFFSYQPIPVSPLAMPVDSALPWKNNHRLKLGAGNFSGFLAEGRFSFGDGKQSITTLKGDFLHASSPRFAQQTHRFGVDITSLLNTANDLEFTTHAYFNTNTMYRYGYQPETLVYSKDQLLLVYNSVGIETAVKNKTTTPAGINYNPSIAYYRFTNNTSSSENNIVLKLPMEKIFTKIFLFKLALTADLAGLKTPIANINNHLFVVNPAIVFNTPNVKINLGIKPGWDNANYKMLPDIRIESAIPSTALSVELGWVGNFVKNGFRSIAAFNPWIGNLNTMANTSITEQFIGIKGGKANHLSFNGKFAYQQINNQFLFVNEAGDGKNFTTIFEPELKTIKLTGELNYAVQDNFSVLASAAFTQFNQLSKETHAWGLVPFEATAGMHWKALNDLQVKADLFYRTGSLYRDAAFQAKRLSPAIDMNLGLEFSLQPKLNLWLQMNNLFNNIYQRWNQYPVFGFNVMGGVVYSFQ